MLNVRIIHFSDWHGKWRPLPEADIYVCTGDMMRNYPKIERYYEERIIPSREEKNQAGWLRKMDRKGGLRRFLGSPEAPVVAVRGNHDFVDLGPGFGGEVYEIGLDPTVVFEVRGLRFGGVRGINYIGGTWSDEFAPAELDDLSRQLPDMDILCTHAPPAGTMDCGFGVRGFASYLQNRYYMDKELKAHCFGHIHEACGIKDAGTIYSNAATTYNVITV